MLRHYEWTHTNAPYGYALANAPYECGPENLPTTMRTMITALILRPENPTNGEVKNEIKIN